MTFFEVRIFFITQARNWIIDNISQLETETLCLMAPQLIYALYYEPYHWNRLVEFLLDRCKTSLNLSHTVFWILSCSVQLDSIKGNIKTRLLLIKSAILGLLNQSDRDDLLSQETLTTCLCELAEEVKNSKEDLRKIVLKEGLLNIMKKFVVYCIEYGITYLRIYHSVTNSQRICNSI